MKRNEGVAIRLPMLTCEIIRTIPTNNDIMKKTKRRKRRLD
jgi:hypothetical protein